MFLFISDLEFLINVLEGRVKAMQRGYFLMFKSKKQMKNRIRQLKKKIIKLEKRIIDLDNITFWVFIWISSNLFNVVVELRLFCFIMITLFVFTVFRNYVIFWYAQFAIIISEFISEFISELFVDKKCFYEVCVLFHGVVKILGFSRVRLPEVWAGS